MIIAETLKRYYHHDHMVEWLKAAVCKTVWRNPRGGSNPSMVTVIYTIRIPLCINARDRTAWLVRWWHNTRSRWFESSSRNKIIYFQSTRR